MSDDARRAEATRIVQILQTTGAELNDVEAGFVKRMSEPSAPVSIKQLFWLRDLKDRD